MRTDAPTAFPPPAGAMLDPAAVVAELLREGFGPFLGVPCSFLGPMISVLQSDHPDAYVTTANEGEAVAIAAGVFLAGRQPVVLMQNSGLGNAVNPLTSLCHTLRIPILLLVTWRGEPRHADEPQHRLMGAITPQLLTAMRIRYEMLPRALDGLGPALRRASAHLGRTELPFAFLVPQGSLSSPARPAPADGAGRMLRSEAITEVIRVAGPDTLFVATTGRTARELERDWDAASNLYVVGSMGCASSVGLGVALGAPDRPVVVLDGDGAALMRLEAMATIGRLSPANLTHLVLDNEAYESTGSQPTGSGTVDLCAVARACGYRTSVETDEPRGLAALIEAAGTAAGPHLVRVRIRPGSDPALGRPALAPPASRARFMAGLCPAGEPGGRQ